MIFNGLNVGWPGEIAKKVLRMLQGQPLEQLAPELQAEITLDADPVEWWLVKQKYLWSSARQSVPASVGNSSSFYAFNPVGSGLLCVVLGVIVDALAAGSYDISVVEGIPAGDIGGGRAWITDLRMEQQATPNAPGQISGPQIRQVQAAGYARNVLEQLNQNSVGIRQVREPAWAILNPGWGCHVFSLTVNQLIGGSIYGYSRIATPEELAIGAG